MRHRERKCDNKPAGNPRASRADMQLPTANEERAVGQAMAMPKQVRPPRVYERTLHHSSGYARDST